MKIETNLAEAPGYIQAETRAIVESIGHEAESRAYRASNELATATAFVLRGQRSGRRYNIPGTGRVKYNKRNNTATITYKKYTASAPGEPPAVRTGVFRMGWKRREYTQRLNGSNRLIHALVENDQKVGNYLLGELLENGTSRMAARPYRQRVQSRAVNKIYQIYREPYHWRGTD